MSTLGIDPVQFDRDIEEHGFKVFWERAIVCPNHKIVSGQIEHDANCTSCSRGFQYYGGKTIKALIQHFQTSTDYRNGTGKWDHGQCRITPGSSYQFSYYDRISLLNETILGTFHIIRGQTNNLENKDPLVDQLKHPALAEPLLLRGRAPRSESGFKDYIFGIDYTLDNGNIRWLTFNKSSRPQVNDIYSVVYAYAPRYLIVQFDHHVRSFYQDGVRYPVAQGALAQLENVVDEQSGVLRG